MTLKETYFQVLSKIKLKNPNAYFIAVSRTIPKGVIIERRISLAPSYTLLKDYHNFKVNWEQYTEIYKEEIKGSKFAQKDLKAIKELSEKEDGRRD